MFYQTGERQPIPVRHRTILKNWTQHFCVRRTGEGCPYQGSTLCPIKAPRCLWSAWCFCGMQLNCLCLLHILGMAQPFLHEAHIFSDSLSFKRRSEPVYIQKIFVLLDAEPGVVGATNSSLWVRITSRRLLLSYLA